MRAAKTADILKFRKEHLNKLHTINASWNPVRATHAKGVYFFDTEGNKILDCVNNVTHIGHCHPEYVRRMGEQFGKLMTNSRYLSEQLDSCVRKILGLMPGHLSCVAFVTSGSEANDLALQMASAVTGQKWFTTMEGAYHGQCQSLLDISSYRFMPDHKLAENVALTSMPCTYRGKFAGLPNSSELYVAELEAKLPRDAKPVFIHENMLSCAGQVIPKPDFFPKVYDFVKGRGGVTISDEVQTGFGRLGTHFWGFEYFGLKPDIVTIGKAMGNGYPVAAVVCTPEVMEAFSKKVPRFESTFAGNLPAFVATETVIDVIKSEGLQEHALKTGAYLNSKLQSLLKYSFVGDIRGSGLFQGIEVVEDKASKAPSEHLAKEIATFLRDKNVLISRDGVFENVMKIKPPMQFNNEHVDVLMDTLIQACDHIEAHRK